MANLCEQKNSAPSVYMYTLGALQVVVNFQFGQKIHHFGTTPFHETLSMHFAEQGTL